MRSAARIAYTFRMDPVAVLDDDLFAYFTRLAAYQIVQADLKEQADKMKKK